MKGFSILIFLLFIGSGICFAQEAVEDTPNTDSTTIPQEEEVLVPPEEDALVPSEEDDSSLDDDPYIEDEEFIYKMNQKGDQFIKIGLMVDIPLRPSVGQLKIGGSGTLGYMFFLNSNLAIGGDASFAYMTTLGDNIFTCIPLMAKVMYQFTLGKFEFPITLGIGGAFENYIGDMYFGLIIKPELGVFYRHSPDWSFGANVGWNLLPQWTKDSSYFGVIMDAGITARYHF
ncbi:MAG: hypothetical protein IKK79_08905 [Spirochaetaceae bacterium]|nr:hypothetical protein [Spirochaetaceae bacterium]